MSGLVHEAPVGATVEWYSPPWLFDYLRDDAGQPLAFDLDPCHPDPRLPWIPAREVYSLPADGLALPWFGRKWCNPPYGKETQRWLARCAAEGAAIALVFARTDPDWFHEIAATADTVVFLQQRVRFVDRSGKPPRKVDPKTGKESEGSPGAGSMLLAWGEVEARALERAARMDRNGKPLGTAFWRVM